MSISYPTQVTTALDHIHSYLNSVHTHLRHHKIDMMNRKHLSTYVKKEKDIKYKLQNHQLKCKQARSDRKSVV